MANLRRLDLLIKEIEDVYVQENFRKLKRYLECLLDASNSGVAGVQGRQGPAGSPGPQGIQGVEGPIGPPGDDATFVIEGTSGQVISGAKLLTVDPQTGSLVYADSSSEDDSQVIGISLDAAADNTTVRVLTFGELEDPSFSTFPIGSDLYLGSNGEITSDAVGSGFHVRIGKVIGPSKIFLDIDEKIELCD